MTSRPSTYADNNIVIPYFCDIGRVPELMRGHCVGVPKPGTWSWKQGQWCYSTIVCDIFLHVVLVDETPRGPESVPRQLRYCSTSDLCCEVEFVTRPYKSGPRRNFLFTVARKLWTWMILILLESQESFIIRQPQDSLASIDVRPEQFATCTKFLPRGHFWSNRSLPNGQPTISEQM